MKRRVIPLVLLVVIGGAGLVVLYKYFNRPRGIVLTGIVTTHEVNVSPQIQGRLAQLLVKEGNFVKTGQLLAVIDPQAQRADLSFYQQTQKGAAAQVQQEEAALKFQEAQTRDQIKQAQANLASAVAQQEEAVADLELDRVTFERTEGLYKEQVDPAQSLDQARSAYDAAKAHANSLQKQVDAQKSAVALAQSNEHQITMRLEELRTGERQLAAAAAQSEKAEVTLGYTQLRAPINGVVSALDARQGEVLNVTQPVLTLINPDDLWVRADVEETYVDHIRLGDELKVRLPSGIERMGKVYFRGVDADYATQRDVSRSKRDIKTFEIRLRVDNSDRRLWPGLTAYVMLPPQ